MPGPIPPQAPGAPAPEQEAQEQGGGGAKQLVTDIHNKLAQLSDLIEKAAPESSDEMQGVMASFQGLVDGLGQPAAPKAPQPTPGPVPVEAGNANVKPAL